MIKQVSPNARTGAVALSLSLPLHALAGLDVTLAPLAYAAWLGISFGILCLCEELGSARPLNRAGLVLFGAAFCARSLMIVTLDPAIYARSLLLFAMTMTGALLFWSVALMHRSAAPRLVGLLGTTATGVTVALMVAAHLAVGGFTIWGFRALFEALRHPATDTRNALMTINVLSCLWGLPTAGLLWARNLRSG